MKFISLKVFPMEYKAKQTKKKLKPTLRDLIAKTYKVNN